MTHPKQTKNKKRCKNAACAIDAFLRSRGSAPEPDESDIVDLITDLCHLAEERGYRPSGILITAKNHWEEECYESNLARG